MIFDESQKEGKFPKEQEYEIWIDVYPLTRFLAKHTQAAVKVEGTKEWVRTADIVDPKVEEYEAQFSGEVQTLVKEKQALRILKSIWMNLRNLLPMSRKEIHW